MPLIDQARRAGRTTRYLVPPRDLATVVVEAWIQHYTDEIRVERRRWRIVPDLQPHLIVHRDLSEGVHGPIVVGARTTWKDARVERRAWSVGLTLRPGVLPAFTGHAASDLVDRSARADEVWGAAGRWVRAQVREAGTPEAVVEVLYSFVRERLARTTALRDWRVGRLLSHVGDSRTARISEVSRALGLSDRTLRCVWRRDVGLSPRQALSIERVHRAVDRALAAPKPLSWTRVAVGAGFYDQSHLIRDFHRFLGETPEAFLKRGLPGLV